MGEKLLFKPAKKKEFNVVLNLYQQAGARLGSMNLKQWHYWSDPPEEKLAWLREGLDQKEFFLVSNQNHSLIGMFRLLKSDPLYWDEKGLEKGVHYVHSLVISNQFSGKGLGKKILRQIIEDLKSKNVQTLRLDCEAANAKLCAYYEGFGFQKVGEKQTPYSKNNLYEMSLCS